MTTKREERAALKREVRAFVRAWLKRGEAHDVRAELDEIVAEAFDAETRTEPKTCRAPNGGEHQHKWHCGRPFGHTGNCVEMR